MDLPKNGEVWHTLRWGGSGCYVNTSVVLAPTLSAMAQGWSYRLDSSISCVIHVLATNCCRDGSLPALPGVTGAFNKLLQVRKKAEVFSHLLKKFFGFFRWWFIRFLQRGHQHLSYWRSCVPLLRNLRYASAVSTQDALAMNRQATTEITWWWIGGGEVRSSW